MKTNDDSFFADPLDPRREARELSLEVLCRLLIWMADAPTLEGRGVRTSVALYCVRPDLICETTVEEIGERAGCTGQAITKLVDNFRLTTGLTP